MSTLADLCDLMIEPSPCNEDEERRNWMMLVRLRDILCELLGTSDGDALLNLTRFRLTNNLAPGGSATAVKLSYPGGAVTAGDQITVHDVDPSEPWRGLVAYEGWAAQREGDSTDYNIVVLERIARRVRGTLAGDLSGGSASANVTEFDDGKDPGATVTVHDPNAHWPQSLTGATYEAVYNVKLARYEVIECQKTEWVATATAAQDYSPSTASISISGVIFKTYANYDHDPATPTVALNPFGLTGYSGDTIHIQRRAYDGQWEIITGDEVGGGGGGSPVVYFVTTLPLHIGGSCSANTLVHDGSTYVPTKAIQVFDPYSYAGGRGMWSGPAGLKGMARQREDNPLYYTIIWMEMHARFVICVLTEDMGETTSQQATATVLYAFGQGVTPGTTITVHDDQNKFKYALEGASCYAIRNEYLGTSTPATPYYTIYNCDQLAMHGQAQLTSDMCGSGAQVTQFQGWSIFPHGQTPPLGTVNEAENPYQLAARESSPVLLMFRDNSLGSGGKDYDYVVAQAKHVEQLVVIKNRFADGCWQDQKQVIYAMLCADPGDFKSYICGLDCP